MGFADDMEKIIAAVGSQLQEGEERKHQVLLFSATVPAWVQNISRKYLRPDHLRVDLVGREKQQASGSVEHLAICCHWGERAEVLADVLTVHAEPKDRVIIFCERKKEVNELVTNSSIRVECQPLHGDVAQNQREITLKGFREGRFPVLCATDVAGRGIDIKGVQVVICCEPPEKAESYVHRSGRTGRAGETGKSIVFFTPKQAWAIANIERRTKIRFKRIGAPQPCDMLEATAETAAKALRKVGDETLDLFKSSAAKLIEEFGAEKALAAALAQVAGYAGGKTRSLLSGTSGAVTVKATHTKSVGIGWFWSALRNALGYEAAQDIRGISLSTDGFSVVFDLPTGRIDLVKAYGTQNFLTLEVCKELPPMQTEYEKEQERGGGGRRGGGGGYGGRRGGGRSYGGRSGGGGGWNRNRGGRGRSGGRGGGRRGGRGYGR
jgi:ATP-dependent RNA helicase DDX21